MLEYNHRERENPSKKKGKSKAMSKKKKNGKQDKTLKILILITAILNLIKAICDLIGKFLE